MSSFAPAEWGHAVPADFFSSLQKEEDLVWYDGPLLSLFRDPAGDAWLLLWVDVEDGEHGWNRWLCVRVSEDRLASYRSGALGLCEMILDPTSGPTRILDLDGQIHPLRAWEGRASDLPNDYLPHQGARF